MMARRTLFPFGLLVFACTPQGDPAEPPGAGTETSRVALANEGPATGEGAQKLYDEAVRQYLAGDQIAYNQKLAEVIARYPDSRYARRARAGLGDLGLGVAGIGVLAAVAIPAFLNSIRQAKSTEATVWVETLYQDEHAHYIEHQAFKTMGPYPATVPAGGDGVRVDPSAWQAAGFTASPPESLNYQLQVVVDPAGTGFTARALGDLNADGVYSTYEKAGRLDENGVLLSDAMFRFNELE